MEQQSDRVLLAGGTVFYLIRPGIIPVIRMSLKSKIHLFFKIRNVKIEDHKSRKDRGLMIKGILKLINDNKL